jgi:NADH-quinone oxidoreductase subunit J
MSLVFAQSLLAQAVSAPAAPTGAGPMPLVLFLVFAAMTVLAAFTVALARNIVRAAVGLLFALAGVSGLYFLLHAEFLAAVQLVVYVGGTLILMVFGVMLTSKSPAISYDPRRWEVLWGMLVAAVLGVPLVWLMLNTHWRGQIEGGAMAVPGLYSVKDLGQALLDPAGFMVPFELVSLLLLAVMIGAAYLAKSRRMAPAAPARPSAGDSGVLKNTRAPDGSTTMTSGGEVL